jgi:hypothetical protein
VQLSQRHLRGRLDKKFSLVKVLMWFNTIRIRNSKSQSCRFVYVRFSVYGNIFVGLAFGGWENNLKFRQKGFDFGDWWSTTGKSLCVVCFKTTCVSWNLQVSLGSNFNIVEFRSVVVFTCIQELGVRR